MHNQETCFDCGKLSPPTNTDNTLTSSFGWRMVRRSNESGEMQGEWRCASCWARFKVLRAVTPPHGVEAVQAPSSSSSPPPMRKKP